MKKFTKTIAIIFLSVGIFNIITYAGTIMNADISNVKIFINNVEEKFKNPIVLINNVTYVPLREINEKLNMTVNWDSENKAIMINDKQEVLYPFETDDGMWGYKDNAGNVIVDPIYYWAEEFYDDRALVRKSPGGDYGYINNKGNEVIQCKYFEAYSFSNGAALVYLADYTDADMWSYIDKDGNLLFNKTFPLARSFKEEYAVVLKEGYGFPVPPEYDIQKKWAYINKNGEFASDMVFEEAEDFFNGYACVKNNGKWGILNKKFELVIPYQYDEIKIVGNAVGEIYGRAEENWSKIMV